MKRNNNTIEETDNIPLQFTCPVCGSHELVIVETHIVHYSVVKVNESGDLEYQPTTVYVENDGNREDCYFACAGYHPGSNRSCDFVPNYPDYDSNFDPYDNPDNRISRNYDMLQWIKDHQTPATE